MSNLWEKLFGSPEPRTRQETLAKNVRTTVSQEACNVTITFMFTDPYEANVVFDDIVARLNAGDSIQLADIPSMKKRQQQQAGTK